MNRKLNSNWEFMHPGSRSAATLLWIILRWRLLWLKTRIERVWWLTRKVLDSSRLIKLESVTGLLEDSLASS